jgi:ribosomal protein S18 acetylase RimI-like enzyme
MSPVLPFELRDARDEELDAIAELTLRAYGEYASRMTPAAWSALEGALANALATREPAERIVAVRDGELLGSVMLYPVSARAYDGAVPEATWPEVRLLAVSPAARGQGVGEALMKECVRRADAAGADQVGLHTSESMHSAIRMYEKMGFVRVPEHDFQPEGAELVTAYRLFLGEPQVDTPGA